MGTRHRQPVSFESIKYWRCGDELQSALMVSLILWCSLLACPTFSWKQEASKGHSSKKSNCVRLVRKTCIVSFPRCIPQKKSFVFQFSEKCPSFENDLVSHFCHQHSLSCSMSHQSYIPFSARILEISFQQQLVQDNVHLFWWQPSLVFMPECLPSQRARFKALQISADSQYQMRTGKFLSEFSISLGKSFHYPLGRVQREELSVAWIPKSF